MADFVGWSDCCRSQSQLLRDRVCRRLGIGSVSLFADSVDFLEDASINILVAVALGWSAINRARLGMLLSGIILVPGVATLC
jgi:hypothetical protein